MSRIRIQRRFLACRTIWPVSNTEWVDRILARHAIIEYGCFGCGRGFLSKVYFAEHLVHAHGVRDLVLLRFLGRDWWPSESGRPNQCLSTPERPSASSEEEFEPFPVEMPRA